MSRLTAALATLRANWRCALCDTYNTPTDRACISCGSGPQ